MESVIDPVLVFLYILLLLSAFMVGRKYEKIKDFLSRFGKKKREKRKEVFAIRNMSIEELEESRDKSAQSGEYEQAALYRNELARRGIIHNESEP